MNYLTEYYKKRSIQLQNQLRLLEAAVASVAGAADPAATAPNPNISLVGGPDGQLNDYRGYDVSGQITQLNGMMNNPPSGFNGTVADWNGLINYMINLLNNFGTAGFMGSGDATGADIYWMLQTDWGRKNANHYGLTSWPFPRIPRPDNSMYY